MKKIENLVQFFWETSKKKRFGQKRIEKGDTRGRKGLMGLLEKQGKEGGSEKRSGTLGIKATRKWRKEYS